VPPWEGLGIRFSWKTRFRIARAVLSSQFSVAGFQGEKVGLGTCTNIKWRALRARHFPRAENWRLRTVFMLSYPDSSAPELLFATARPVANVVSCHHLVAGSPVPCSLASLPS